MGVERAEVPCRPGFIKPRHGVREEPFQPGACLYLPKEQRRVPASLPAARAVALLSKHHMDRSHLEN